EAKILETADILYAGDFNRFQAGNMIVANCGYGMGSNRFYQNCRENSNLRPLFDSGKYNYEFIDNLIKTYRKTYSKIIEFWTQMEKCFRWVIKYPHEIVYYKFDKTSVTVNANKHVDLGANYTCYNRKEFPNAPPDSWHNLPLLTFRNDKGTVFINLPSGRELRYSHARIIKDRYKGTISWRWGKLWGGSIVENIVQATSRDVLAEAILMIGPFNPIVCHVHDSISVLIKKDNVRFALPKIEKAMRRVPEWAEGVPIDIETKVKETF
ncbi:hypothetical protein LCGC14_1779300, partial [marine sediment metagenome]